MKRISVDIGGTFTDCFFVWDDQHIEAKALTTHHNLALGFNEALDLACKRAPNSTAKHVLPEVDSVRYATTLGTNALIERKGPRVGALVTHGFEDTIPLSRGRGYGEGLDSSMQQNLPAAERPEPLVHRKPDPIGARAGQLRRARSWCRSTRTTSDTAVRRTRRRRRGSHRRVAGQLDREPRTRAADPGA